MNLVTKQQKTEGWAQTLASGLRQTLGLVQGFAITLLHVFRRPLTIQYPEQKRTLPARSRARIVLTRDPKGEERCVACYLCSAACPVDCISMQSMERQDGRRQAAWFRINFARCIFCGFCEEACPTLAIQLTHDFEMVSYDWLSLVAEKEDLLIDGGGKHPDYDFYEHTGIDLSAKKSEHPGKRNPVDLLCNLP